MLSPKSVFHPSPQGSELYEEEGAKGPQEQWKMGNSKETVFFTSTYSQKQENETVTRLDVHQEMNG